MYKDIAKEIEQKLKRNELITTCVQIRKRKNSNDLKIIISIDDLDNGGNPAYQTKMVLDDIEIKYNVTFSQRLLDF